MMELNGDKRHRAEKGSTALPVRVIAARTMQHSAPKSKSIPLHHPAEPEWEECKSTIEDLYMRRNLPLRVVAHTMRQTHGFKARCDGPAPPYPTHLCLKFRIITC